MCAPTKSTDSLLKRPVILWLFCFSPILATEAELAVVPCRIQAEAGPVETLPVRDAVFFGLISVLGAACVLFWWRGKRL